MKKLLPILLSVLFAQANAQNVFVENLIVGKVKQGDVAKLEKLISDGLNIADVNVAKAVRKYPNAQKPQVNQTDRHGNAFVDLTRTYRFTLAADVELSSALRKLETNGMFEWVEAVSYASSFFDPNDPQVGSLDHLLHANIYAAWDSTQGDTNVVMGITDTSFDLNHEDLQDNLKYNYADPIDGNDNDNDGYTDNYRGWDIWGNDNNVFFSNDWHGTGVLAVSAATTNNGVGMSGAGFKCKYLPVKIANDATNGNTTIVTADGYDAIAYCADRDCKVINCSWGSLIYSNDGQDVVNYAVINKDAVVVASAGNTNIEEFRYPASYHRAISVTGVHNSDQFNNGVNAPFTRNDSVDVCAQGYSVMATATVGASGGNEVYQTTGGTSIAAPIVTATVALIRSRFPCYSAIDAMDALVSTADDIESVGTNSSYAGKIGKRVNALAAVQLPECITVGTDERSNEIDFGIYPNPNNGSFSIRMPDNDSFDLTVVDGNGKTVHSSRSFKGLTDLSLDLSSGIYLVSITRNGEVLGTKRFNVIR